MEESSVEQSQWPVTQTAEASPPAALICFMCSSVCADNNRQGEKY